MKISQEFILCISSLETVNLSRIFLHILSGFNEFLENLIIYISRNYQRWFRTYIPCKCKSYNEIYLHSMYV
jgi:hypothetical protein